MYSGGGVWGLGIFIGGNGEVWRGCGKYNLSLKARKSMFVCFIPLCCLVELANGLSFFFLAVLYINILSNN